MKKKIAVAYLRCSTDRQDYSVSDQWDALRKWAKQNGYVIIRKYSDDGISGAKAEKRPGFLQMVSDIALGDFEAVLIWDSYRFARNLIEFLTYKQMFRDNNIRVIAITEPQLEEDNDAQLYIDALNGASGEMYLRKLSKDITRALLAKADRGEYSGFAPYGFTKPKYEQFLYVNEKEAEVVKYMYQSILDGLTYFEIVEQLTASGIKTHRGNFFDCRGVRRILENPLYKGWFTANIKGQEITRKAVNISGIIIEEEMWGAVQEKLSENKSKYKNSSYKPQRKHWLSSLIRCACCGQTYVYVTRPGNRKDRFRCKGYGRGFCRSSSSVTVELLETLVLDKLSEIYDATPEELQKCVVASVPKNVVDYDMEISKIEAALTRAKKAYLAEIDTLEEYAENKKRLTAQLEEMKERKASDNKPIPINRDQFRSRITNAIGILSSDCSEEEKMTVAGALIERVVLNSSEKTLDIYFFA